MENNDHIIIAGGGLAGSEAAWQAAQRGVRVKLYEMKPGRHSPAHHSDNLSELVCSNSLRSDRLENAVGVLKEEMRRMDSLIMKCADETRVPAGGALAVDREGFSKKVTEYIENHPLIELIHQEITKIDLSKIDTAHPFIVATGPLTSEGLSPAIAEITGKESLYFYDAAAPIVSADSIDMSKAFRAARYDRGEADYINCPMDREQYQCFYDALISAETAEMKQFEKEILFEGCMPVESMAKRGRDTLLFGPLKPVGLINPATGKEAYAVVQLRQDNAEATMYNIVGFQTHLKWPEQKRVFGMIPGLENAEFMRYGVMHRNTYIHSPQLLDATYQMKSHPGLYFAGQMTGVEGYIESASSGMTAGINAALRMLGQPPLEFTPDTATGALSSYISNASVQNFQPMNVNFGIFAPLPGKYRDKKKKYADYAERALKTIEGFIKK